MTLTVSLWIEATEKLASVTAVVVGGLWIYYNTFRGRTYRPRLQVRLAITPHRVGRARVLQATIAVENKGLSHVIFSKEGTRLELRYRPQLDDFPEPTVVEYEESSSFPVLQSHESIEPALTITEDVLVQMPPRAPDTCELRLSVVAHGVSWSSSASVADFRESRDDSHVNSPITSER